MYRWLTVLLFAILLLPLAPVTAQEFYESPHVILVQAAKCDHNAAQLTRYQTGFRVKGKPGIFTALHGLVDCDSIYTLAGGHQSLIIFEVDVDRDVVRLCAAQDMQTDTQTQQLECLSDEPEAGFAPAAEPAILLNQLKIVGHPAGSPGQYTIESIKAAKTSTDTLASLVGPTVAIKLEARRSPLPTIRVIPLEGALAAGLSGAPVLTTDDQLLGISDASQAEGLSWLIPWSALHLVSIEAAQTQLDRLRGLDPDDFFLSASTVGQAVSTDYVVYSGRVFDEQDNLVDQARVILDLDGESHIVYTDSEGKFEITVAAQQSSRGRIYIQAENYSPLNRLIDLLAGQRQVEQFALRSAASDILYCPFAFRIIDRESEQPIAKADLSVALGGQLATGQADSNGFYESQLPCIDPANARVRVRIVAEGYAPRSETVPLVGEVKEILLVQLAAPTPSPSSTVTPTPQPTATPQPMVEVRISMTGIGFASESQTNEARRRQSALLAARKDADRNLALWKNGAELESVTIVDQGEVTTDTIREEVRARVFVGTVIEQSYDNATGEAQVTVEYVVEIPE